MRLPFQFGDTEVRETAEARARVAIEVDGRRYEGRSAQLMVPRWFDKRAELSNAETIEELRSTIRETVARVPRRRGTALTLSRELREDVASALPEVPSLAAGFGPALVEMASIDALSAATGLPFWQAARDDVFGLAHGAPSDLTAETVARSLAGIGPPRSVRLRHTIGFDAPLADADVGEGAPDDGFPVSLADVIRRTGISAFKIKLKGDPDADLARLRDIAAAIARVPDHTVTLDANEQYAPEPFAAFLGTLSRDPGCRRLFAAIRFVEQPFPREIALSERVSATLPLVIDESDDAEDAFARALGLGWSGTSIKSCKGVLRALLNKARAEAADAILSGEDLTCQPGLCWQQDTAMMSACGVPDVERNGHHFAGGLQGAPVAERRHLVGAHADIYGEERGRVALRIADGSVDIGSLDVVGFGCDTRRLADIDSSEPINY